MKICKLLMVCGLLCIASAEARGAKIYYESFSIDSTSGTDLAFPRNGWQAHGGANGAALTNASAPSGTNNNPAGIGDNRTQQINAGTSHATTDTQTGRAYFVNNSGTNRYGGMFWTDEYTVVTATNSVQNMRFWARNNSAPVTNRIAVQVGGNWFISSAGAVSTGAASITAGDGTWNQFGVDFTTSQWQPLTFNVGVAFDQVPTGTAQALPGGNITAFGVYFPQIAAAETLRIDGFEINANPVPEPTAYAIGLLGAGLLAATMLRRKSKLFSAKS